MNKCIQFRQVLILLILAAVSLQPLSAAAFERVAAVNFAGQDFVFPDDIRGAEMHVLFLGIATDQDNGEYQGEELIKWQRALDNAGLLGDGVRVWHFPVVSGAPFFVKGLIRRGIAKNYTGLLPPEQGAVLFIKDVQEFAREADVPDDGQPTVMVYVEGQGAVAVVRGEVSAAGIEMLGAVLQPAPESANEAGVAVESDQPPPVESEDAA